MSRIFTCLFLLASLCLSAVAQATPEPQTLVPGQPVERELAGGESHTFQLPLTAGQFARFRLEQRAIDGVLTLSAPDGKQLTKLDFTQSGEEEMIFLEAAVTGSYQLSVRGLGVEGLRGSYRLDMVVQATSTTLDRKRVAVQELLVEALELGNQEARTAPQVIEKMGQVLPLVREIGEPLWLAYSLAQTGRAYENLKQYAKAIEYYEQSLAVARNMKDRAREGITLAYLGSVYSIQSQYEKSLTYYEPALTIARKVGVRKREGNLLVQIATDYQYLGQYEKAIEYYEKALPIFRELKDRTPEAVAVNYLGMTYTFLSRYEKAILYYEQALAIAREVKNRKGETAPLNNLGQTYLMLGQYEKAVEYYEQALVLIREMKDRAAEGTILNNLGDAYDGLKEYEKAMAFSEQALAIARETKGRMSEYYALSALARTEGNRGNLAQARAHYEECLEIAEWLRREAGSPESRASLFTLIQSRFERYIDVLMRLHKTDPPQGLAVLAFEASERQRGRSLLDLLAESHTDLRQGVDAALLERERTLAKKLSAKAQTQAKTPEAAAALKLEISQLETEYERAQAAIRAASPHYAALTQPQPLKLKEIQQQLDADTLLLEYALGEERSYLWAITKDSLTSYELPKEAEIKQSALQVYELLTARSINKRNETPPDRRARLAQAETRLPAAAQALSQQVLGPVAAQLGNKRLVIVADGALQYIPFAMLPEPVVGDRLPVVGDNANANRPPTTDHRPPLIVKHEIISLPSASALAIQRTELAGRKPAPKLLAVIADPVFDRTDERLKAAATATSEQAQAISFNDARSIEHLAEKDEDKASGTVRKLVIPRLPYTRQEATQLLALTPKNTSFSALDFQANRTTVLDPALSQYRYVHFATHGLADTERPGLSSLVLSTVDAQGKAQDGFLRANDIYNLKLPAELVVLSACQTGLGKDVKGEGLVGLTRGFMYAGAARVVVSLWSVNDRATSDLMTKFYQKMLKQGARPAAALRAAQVEMRKQPQWQSPYYWAAFVMQGEWK